MQERTVLLTGETGFLGKRVRARFEAEPGVVVKLLPGRLGELTNSDRLNADTVIHLAASVRKGVGTADLGEIIDANVVGLWRLLSSLDPHPRRLLFASTTDVYGEHSAEWVSEESMLDPMSEYAASKLFGERIVIGDARARGYECLIMRFGHIYGPGEESFEKFVPTTIRALMKGRPPTVVGNGETRRDLLYVDDAAEAVCRLALSQRKLPEVVNIASAATYSLQEIAETLIDIVGFIGGIRYLRDRSNPTSLSFDTRLSREIVGGLDEVTLEEGLRSEIEHVLTIERGSSRAPDRV